MMQNISIISKTIWCNDEVLELTNQRVIYWKAKKV